MLLGFVGLCRWRCLEGGGKKAKKIGGIGLELRLAEYKWVFFKDRVKPEVRSPSPNISFLVAPSGR